MALKAKLGFGLARNPIQVDDVKSVVVEDAFGHPLHVFVVLNDKATLSLTRGDKDFEKTLSDLGILNWRDYEVL